jgi:flagellin
MTVINTNLNALFSQNSIAQVSKSQSAAMQQLSTGSRINSAKDDAAGLAIATRMTSDINGYGVAVQNSNQGMNMAQTADGALNNVSSILQTMRQLAVQSSNGTMTASNRQATQAEYKQLSNQIDSIAQTTTSNGISLLNGTAGNIVLQTGVNQGNTMTMSIGSVQTKDIGIGSLASLTSIQTPIDPAAATPVVPKAMTAGDLLINGVQVGPSLASNDSSSFALASASSIAKAAAINLVSAQSGVTATVDPTVVQGSAMTAGTSVGTISINGVTTASVTTGADTTINRQNFVTAINEISKQTGVTAVNTGDATHGIQLVASDGRNISVTLNGLSASDTGLNAKTGTTKADFTGQIELHSTTNSAISLSTTATGSIANSGFAVGTFQPNIAQVTTNARAVVTGGATQSAIQATVGTFDGGTLSLNGVTIGASLATDDTSSDTTAYSSMKQNSGIAIAAAINRSSGLTGVSATAAPTTVIGSSYSAGALNAGFQINGVTIAAVGALSKTPSKTAVINAINEYTGQTGVTASDNGYGITYTAQDGRNISLWAGTGTAAAAVGLGGTNSTALGVGAAGSYSKTAVTTYSQVQLQSNSKFTVTSGNDGNVDAQLNGSKVAGEGFTQLGFQSGSYGGANNGLKISQIDLSTQSGAQAAITAIDAAISTVSAIQSNVGAYQNRLSSTVTNLQTMTTNMTDSRSTIRDTNYNTTTTALARSQIISQAATAMLAQANQSGQTVLSLLK